MTQAQDLSTAISDFVKGCKTDGLWDSIEHCHVLAAWDGLNAIQIPIKGNAGSFLNFVATDYDRTTGLNSDSTLKTIETGFYSAPGKQDNFHFAAYINSESQSTSRWLITQSTSSATSFGAYRGRSGWEISGSSAGKKFGPAFSSPGLLASSRDNSASFDYELFDDSGTITSNSNAWTYAQEFDMFLDTYLCRSPFYSLGSALDLQKYRQRIEALINGIEYATNPDLNAVAYIQAVEAADGQSLEFGVAAAIDGLVKRLKADALWTAIEHCALLAGPRTLNGILTPLKGTGPSMAAGSEFVESDYSRKLGLQGSATGVQPYLLTGVASTQIQQDNNHASVYISEFGTHNPNSFQIIFRASNSSIQHGFNFAMGATPADSELKSRNFTSGAYTGPAGFVTFGPTLLCNTRNTASSFSTYAHDASATTNNASTAMPYDVYQLFGPGSVNNFDGKLAFYSLGTYMGDMPLLDYRIKNYLAQVANAIA
jgi:hypothetical protein